ncbi:transient receptor potential cation channel subfamily M member 2 isoform X2 [Osmerus eperlanus]|uniref:transient receptor potential cation channel subfamily M member 2 isoform X2 n=1 Tax=Osmerus eperlanus TaxID=29151 RepID=UPI002E15B3DD
MYEQILVDFSSKEMFLNSNNKVHPSDVNQLGNITLSRLLTDIQNVNSLAPWIREKINKKECCFYIEDGSEGVCKCGYQKDQHTDEAIMPEEFIGETWDQHRHTRDVPTDAFGDISFKGSGKRTAKYVRVSPDTSTEVLYQLMTEQWKLRPPNLLLSVTGGAKNFYMKPQLKNLFRRGLINVAQSTGAWIVTGGTHTGVMRHVGRAMRDYTLSSASRKGQVVAIGVATWGTIHNRHKLVHPQGRFPANYYMEVENQGHLSCLDNNHTHFLLVDNGTHGHYSVEIALRCHLEKLISQKLLGNGESGVKIPVVCVVLDGGPGTLNTIFNAMRNVTPCVVLEGSGRLADVISQAAGLPPSRVTLALIHQLMKRFFSSEYDNFSELEIIDWTKKIQDIIRMPHLLTVFRISEEKHGDLDVAILQALLKASRTCEPPGGAGWAGQLELAVAWNRVDIAESEIFTENSQWKSKDLHQAMFSALVGGKPGFVRLMLENGVYLNQFLEEDRTLCELYSQMSSCLFLRRLAKRVQAERGPLGGQSSGARGGRKLTLGHVAHEVRHLLGSFTQPLYTPPPSTGLDTESLSFTLQAKDLVELHTPGTEREERELRDPARDLFLWAILQTHRELAHIAWEQCTDSMAAALAASRILKKLLREGEEGEEAVEMRELASQYENHAIGVFSECHKCDKERAQKLLVRVSPLWGRTTCLRLALEADNKSFVAQPGVQGLLTQIWCGELAVNNPVWRLLLCMLLFPLINTGFLVYRRDEAIHREKERSKDMETMNSVTGSCAFDRGKSHILSSSLSEVPSLTSRERLSCLSRLAGFYSSPQVKFYWNIVSYFVFLWIFAIVLMMDFWSTPSWLELLLYVWIFSLVCEEVRQLFHDPDGISFHKKCQMYINEHWNALDVLSILLFIIGLGCRLTTVVFYAGKVILCIDFIIFCLRLMAIFTISRTLGPKIIIVKRMMMDLFFFMFLLSIWVVAYGVAKQGILIHNEDRLGWIVRGAVYEPYLIIFGNVPTNIDNTQFDDGSCTVNGDDPLKPRCPVLDENHMPIFPEWLTILLLCVYLLFANILLLNLLIAIFNYTFQVVQDNSDTIWKFQRYELIKEYHSRPAAPPPFILLSHLYLFIRLLVLRRSPLPQQELKEELSEKEEEKLLSWESLMKDNYLISTRQGQSQSTESQIQDTAKKVGTMTELLERDDEMESVAIVKRLARLEEQVTQSTKALQWIMNSLQSQGHQATDKAPILASGSSVGDLMSLETEMPQNHVNARQLYYPDSTVTRFPVPEEKVSWEVEFNVYVPPVYVAGVSEGMTDQAMVVTLDNYRNPGGRTGVMGRGALNSLGPNLILDPVFTRWQDNKRSVLEFLAVQENEGQWALPGGPVQLGEPLPERLLSILGRPLYEKLKVKVSEGRTVYEGYVDDCRNTDNAWLETTVINIHLDRREELMADLNCLVNSSVCSPEGTFQWQEISSRTVLCSYQREALRQVAKLHEKRF